MRVAAIYDIHGNLPALEAVLAEIERIGADRLVVGGDVYPGPMAAEALACLRAVDLPTDYLSGNGEREVLAVRDGEAPPRLPPPVLEALAWHADTMSEADADFLAAWPATVEVDEGQPGWTLFCHATPRSDSDIFTRDTPEHAVAPEFTAVGAPRVVCGHTHMQFERTVGGTRVMNAGSVGMPFGEPGAYWLLLDGSAEFKKTDYDLDAAAERLRGSRYPRAQDFADNQVVRPRSAADALAALEAGALGRRQAT